MADALLKIFFPHLKSNAAFEWMLSRELAGTLVLIFAAGFAGGIPFVALTGIVLLSILASHFIFQAAGFSISPRWDISLFHQGLLLVLFLPAGMPLGGAAFIAATFVLFYRFFGGRSGYVLQPVCLALAFLQNFGTGPVFQLEGLAPLAAAFVFALWFVIRFPRTGIEARRMVFVLAAAALLSLLHEKNIASALVWSVAAGELIFDPALAPFSKNGRFAYQGVALGLLAALLAGTSWEEAMLVSGLTMSFLAGWIEERGVKRKIYGQTLSR